MATTKVTAAEKKLASEILEEAERLDPYFKLQADESATVWFQGIEVIREKEYLNEDNTVEKKDVVSFMFDVEGRNRLDDIKRFERPITHTFVKNILNLISRGGLPRGTKCMITRGKGNFGQYTLTPMVGDQSLDDFEETRLEEIPEEHR